MTSIVELIVQLYFAWRVWTLSQGTLRHFLTSTIVILSICTFGMGISVYVIGLTSASWTAYEDGSQKIIAPFTLSMSMASNLSIMLSLIYLFRRGRTQVQRTNYIINTLIFYTIQAGALIVVTEAVVIALDVYVDRVGFAYIGVYAMQGNLYANSLLASLNARTTLRSIGSNGDVQVPGESSTRRVISRNIMKLIRCQESTVGDTIDTGSSVEPPGDSYQLHTLPTASQVSEPREDELKYRDV
ncbi:hypothetical protein BDY19DRAFT_100896 [Irpex rosettiformis]|uniref:Uncharacterized protein n=1 Tax=Irpex rosettiformis TaxID=378272 RepID=A0ACB8TM49_9APHY|nr:hypothetical protein BDY19DRAFT_100896 [Irpex rosettiformis]